MLIIWLENLDHRAGDIFRRGHIEIDRLPARIVFGVVGSEPSQVPASSCEANGPMR
jgi:hypothetical protein